MPEREQLAPLRSKFANDPDMQEIVRLFAEELPQRMATMNKAWGDQQLDTVKRIAHQLRGSSAGYGFPAVGQVAGKLEDELRAAPNTPDALEKLRTSVDELISMCRRVQS